MTCGPDGFAGALTANAYLGGLGIAAALAGGADIVVTGRVTDASLVVGPAVWWHGWSPTAYDELAGAVVAGHVLECGCQATGGNFSGFGAMSQDRGGGSTTGVSARRGRRRRVVGDHQARRHGRARERRHGDRPAAVRGAVDRVPRPRRHHPSRLDPAHRRRTRSRPHLRRPWLRTPGAAEGGCQRDRRPSQLRRAGADRPRPRGEGRVGARPARATAHRGLGHLDPRSPADRRRRHRGRRVDPAAVHGPGPEARAVSAAPSAGRSSSSRSRRTPASR